jgi:protein tyrosine/serine phosphatase
MEMRTKDADSNSRRFWRVLGCLLVVGILPLLYAVEQHRTLYHFEPVDPGKLYRSGTLSRRGLEKVHSLTGIKTIINLRSEPEKNQGSWYATEKDFASASDITLIDLPMLPDVPPDSEQIRQFLQIVTHPGRLPALVHCEMGVIRTGMMVAVYRIALLEEDNEEVLRRLPLFGHTLDNRPAVREFILHFAPSPDSVPAPLQTGRNTE